MKSILLNSRWLNRAPAMPAGLAVACWMLAASCCSAGWVPPLVQDEVEVTEVQEWSRDGVTNDWHLVSTFEGLAEIAAN